ncbi:hypothetical protein V8E53_000355, partial [Lactarius tabidus]
IVSVLALSFLLPVTIYPASWPRLESESLGMLTAAQGHHHHPGQHDDAASNMLEAVGHAVPDRVFAQISRSGDIVIAPRRIRCPSSCEPADQVSNTVQVCLLIRVRMPRHVRSHKAVDSAAWCRRSCWPRRSQMRARGA